MTASVATVVGSLSDAPATMPEPKAISSCTARSRGSCPSGAPRRLHPTARLLPSRRATEAGGRAGSPGRMAKGAVMQSAAFETDFVRDLDRLLHLRRDVRRFARDPLAPHLLDELLEAARCAPSVGYSQPWRFVLVEGDQARAIVGASFRAANAEALGGYDGEAARVYAGLKLAGLDDAPVQ